MTGISRIKNILILMVAGVALLAPAPLRAGAVYLTEVSVRAGYHAFRGSDSWSDGYARAMEEDLFFRDENFSPDNNHVYYSDNVDTSVEDLGPGFPVITLEYSLGIEPEKVPLLKTIGALHGVRGLRTGISLSYYPLSSAEKNFYSGTIVYHNTKAVAPEPALLEYRGDITLREKLFILAPSLGLSYFHERGVAALRSMKIVPFAGLELGTALVSGERKISLRSDVLHVASTGEERAVEADIQESFFNGFSLRAGLFAGGRIEAGAAGAVDFRVGFVYQETPVTMTRSGSWSETINGAKYTRRVHDESRRTVFSQTGFLVTLGYSRRLK
jgi:hypothetical protein